MRNSDFKLFLEEGDDLEELMVENYHEAKEEKKE